MLQIFSKDFHKRFIRDLFKPDFTVIYGSEQSSVDILRKGASFFGYVSITYVIFYFLAFLVGYPYYSRMNEAMLADFQMKGHSNFTYIMNSYPFNVVYIFSALILFVFFVSALGYFFAKFFEEDKREFRAHLGICLHATSLLIFILFFVFIANTIFPFRQPVGIVLFSSLIALWIIFFGLGLYLSSKIFVGASYSYFSQNKRRAALTWLFPLLLFIYMVLGIITS
ncbi:hypothetical protein [Leptospira idonii]|uniref:Yip1 domain-containing protein n=1 Tax=Leptospira idonii TaxID=1193500 RepID=A0A4V3JXV7_9LEPT|nr:hypothetical protein [Leptospira idonii]TGN16948.1 hypothetical protein EHS15_18730 [Leptospira idonii]